MVRLLQITVQLLPIYPIVDSILGEPPNTPWSEQLQTEARFQHDSDRQQREQQWAADQLKLQEEDYEAKVQRHAREQKRAHETARKREEQRLEDERQAEVANQLRLEELRRAQEATRQAEEQQRLEAKQQAEAARQLQLEEH